MIRRLWRWLVGLLSIVLLVLVVGYIAAPQLIAWLAPRIADTYVDELTLSGVSRPDVDRAQVQQLAFVLDGHRLTLNGVEITYDLLARKLTRLSVDELVVELGPLNSATDADGPMAFPELPSIRIHSFSLKSRAYERLITGDLAMNRDGRYQASAGDGESELKIAGHFGEEELTVDGEGALLGTAMLLVLQLADLDDVMASIGGRFHANLPNPLNAEISSLSGEGEFRVQIAVKFQGGDVRMVTNRLDFSRVGELWKASSAEVNLVGSHGEGWEWQSPAEFEIADSGAFLVRVGDTLKLDGALDSLPALAGSMQLSTVEFAVMTALLDMPEQTVSGSVAVSFTLDEREQFRVESTQPWRLETELGTLSAQTIAAHGTAEQVHMRLVGIDAGVALEDSQLRVPLTEAVLEMSLEDSRWSVIGTVRGAGLTAEPSVTQAGQGDIRVEMPLQLSISRPLLRQWLGWREPYDLDAGAVQAHVTAVISDPMTTYSVQGTLTDARAHFDDILFEGVGVSFELNGTLDDWHVAMQQGQIDRLDSGVVLTSIGFDGRVTEQSATLNNLNGQLLGGSFVVASPLVFDIERESSSFEVALRDLDLAQIAALEGEDVKATGRLSGSLPIAIERGAVSVAAGRLSAAEPGGVINLSESLSQAVAQPGLDFAVRALEDFRYSKLEANVDYSESGDLLAAVRLEGANPNVEKGRAIHYNLNISENVPVLLESLRLQDEVTRRVERKVRK